MMDRKVGNRAAFAGRLLLTAAQKIRGSSSLKVLRSIERTPFLSEEQIVAQQFGRVCELLRIAETEVPYYREMFQSLRITSRDIRNLNDFSKLPILTKDIIRDRLPDLVRENAHPGTLIQAHSGGSTGVPLTFYHTKLNKDMSEAGTFRNLRQCGWTPGEMIGSFWGFNNRLNSLPKWRLEFEQMLRRTYQMDPFHSGPAELDNWFRKWQRMKPSIALGYASTIARFAVHLESTGRTVAPLRGVFTTAEKLYPMQRDIIARVFGCPVYDCYGSCEIRNIAAECTYGRMHINSDYVVLEVDSSSPVMPDGARPFIATSLWNDVMPFIRYRNEDCGELVEGACPCGNNFPIMQLRISRVSDNFIFPNGRVVHGEFFTHLMWGSEGISNFQFHQTAPDAVTLWYVPRGGDVTVRERALLSAVERIKALAPEHAIGVDIRATDNIPLSTAGKHRFTRSDLKLADSAVVENVGNNMSLRTSN
jgi:phenylacetate-CoA ligase